MGIRSGQVTQFVSGLQCEVKEGNKSDVRILLQPYIKQYAVMNRWCSFIIFYIQLRSLDPSEHCFDTRIVKQTRLGRKCS
jgi:hypothetical protein